MHHCTSTTIQPEFVEFETKDGLMLPGLLHEAKKSTRALIYLHGNGPSSVFYNAKNKLPIAEALLGRGISTLYFNNRGAHILHMLDTKKGKERKYGMAYEKIKECLVDIDGAIAFLKKRGYKTLYLAGSSTGANKICVYNFYKPKNEIQKYILLGGGDDVGIYYQLLGKTKFWNTLKTAKQKIRERKGDAIIPDLLPLVFSYTGFYDIANPDGDYNVFPYYEVIKKTKLSTKPLFRHFKSIKKPTLVVYGENDEYVWGNISRAIGVLKNYQPIFDYKIIKGANHSFKDKRRELGETLAKWLQ